MRNASSRSKLVVHVEVVVVKDGLEQRLTTKTLLQPGDGVAAAWQQFTLGIECRIDQLAPAALHLGAQRKCVEEQAQQPLAIFHFGTSVDDQARGHVVAPRGQRHHAQVRRQQQALERHA